MPAQCEEKDKLLTEKKQWSSLLPIFWFNCFVAWIFVIKQVMHFMFIIIMLYTSGSLIPAGSSPIPPTSRSISYNPAPQFLSVQQVVDVPEGSTAVLECRLANLGTQHTVSWLRSSSVSVLTVGSFVFSSDPRLSVASPNMPGQTYGTWSLEIREANVKDSGDYQCQVNTEPKESLDVTLIVRGKNEETMDFNENKKIYSVFREFKNWEYKIHETEDNNLETNSKQIVNNNLRSTSPPTEIESRNEDLNEVKAQKIIEKSKSVSLTPKPLTTKNSSDPGDKTVDADASLIIQENVDAHVTEKWLPDFDNLMPNKPESNTQERHQKNPSPTIATPSMQNISNSFSPNGEHDLEFETLEENELLKMVQENQSKSEIASFIKEPPPMDNEKSSSDNGNSLLAPLISLSLVAMLIITLGSIRGFYSRYVNPKQSVSRSTSRTGTIDSRRSSGSRKSEDNVSNSKRMRRKERELELERERMMIYDEIRQKPRLSPLIEVIEPTPPLYRRSPIFQMTSLQMLNTSDESEYEADRSDATGNERISDDERKCKSEKREETLDFPDHNAAEDTSKAVSSHESMRIKIKTFLSENFLIPRLRQDEEGGGEEARRTRTKLVDNVNTFL